MQDYNQNPVGEGHPWLPIAPTTTHGTRDLIDTRLVEPWDQARAAAIHNQTIRDRREYKAAQAQLYR